MALPKGKWFVMFILTYLVWNNHLHPWSMSSRRLLNSATDITELGGVTAKSFRDIILQQTIQQLSAASTRESNVNIVKPMQALPEKSLSTAISHGHQLTVDKKSSEASSMKMTGSKIHEGPDEDRNDITPREYLYTSNFKAIRGKLPSNIPEDKLLIHYSLRQLESSEDLVYINGPRGKRLWDLNNPNPHGLVNDKLRLRKWESVAGIVNATHATTLYSTKAVHIHNEMKIGDVLLLLVDEYRRKNKIPLPKPPEPINLDRSIMHRMMDFGQPPIVMTNSIDENWGFLSTFIANRTTKWINMTNHLRIHYSTYETFKNFVESEKILLIFCSSHIDPVIGVHEKILALPLGIKARTYGYARAIFLKDLAYNKTKLLTINNSGWGPRSAINEMVSKNFDYTVRNSYSHSRKKGEFKDANGVTTFMDHLLEIAQSKFVLCPSGLGYDTYRMWEVILMGSIPVVESNPGFDRTYTSLPVLIVQDFRYLTPELLVRAYPCFINNAHEFKYEMLREDYWVTLFQTAVVTGSIHHVTENHPFRHKYCDFVDYRPRSSVD